MNLLELYPMQDPSLAVLWGELNAAIDAAPRRLVGQSLTARRRAQPASGKPTDGQLSSFHATFTPQRRVSNGCSGISHVKRASSHQAAHIRRKRTFARPRATGPSISLWPPQAGVSAVAPKDRRDMARIGAAGARKPFIETLDATWSMPAPRTGLGPSSRFCIDPAGLTSAPFTRLRDHAKEQNKADEGRYQGSLRPPELCAIHSVPLELEVQRQLEGTRARSHMEDQDQDLTSMEVTPPLNTVAIRPLITQPLLVEHRLVSLPGNTSHRPVLVASQPEAATAEIRPASDNHQSVHFREQGGHRDDDEGNVSNPHPSVKCVAIAAPVMGLWCETTTRSRHGIAGPDPDPESESYPPPHPSGVAAASPSDGTSATGRPEEPRIDLEASTTTSDEDLLDAVMRAMLSREQRPSLRWARQAPTAEEVRQAVRPDVEAAAGATIRSVAATRAHLGDKIDRLSRAHGIGEAGARLERAGAQAWRRSIEGRVEGARREAAEGTREVLEAIRGLQMGAPRAHAHAFAGSNQTGKKSWQTEAPGVVVASRIPIPSMGARVGPSDGGITVRVSVPMPEGTQSVSPSPPDHVVERSNAPFDSAAAAARQAGAWARVAFSRALSLPVQGGNHANEDGQGDGLGMSSWGSDSHSTVGLGLGLNDDGLESELELEMSDLDREDRMVGIFGPLELDKSGGSIAGPEGEDGQSPGEVTGSELSSLSEGEVVVKRGPGGSRSRRVGMRKGSGGSTGSGSEGSVMSVRQRYSLGEIVEGGRGIGSDFGIDRVGGGRGARPSLA